MDGPPAPQPREVSLWSTPDQLKELHIWLQSAEGVATMKAMKALREQSQSGPVSAPLPNWSLCIALYDQYEDCKSEEDYLQFNKGQLIRLIHCDDEDWWWGMTEDGKEGYFASILVRVLPHPPFDVDVHQTLADDLAGSRKEVDDLKRELKKLKEGYKAEKVRQLSSEEDSKRGTCLKPHKVTRAASGTDTKPSGGPRPKSRSKLKRRKVNSRRIKRKSRRRKSKRKSHRRTK